MAKIASLRIKRDWEKWLVESTHQAQPSRTAPVFNEILWMAIKRQWRARLRDQIDRDQGQE